MAFLFTLTNYNYVGKSICVINQLTQSSVMYNLVTQHKIFLMT